jgi:hypothetical protein
MPLSVDGAGTENALGMSMELLGRLGAALGISLVLTLLLLVLYQDDGQRPEPVPVTQAGSAPALP